MIGLKRGFFTELYGDCFDPLGSLHEPGNGLRNGPVFFSEFAILQSLQNPNSKPFFEQIFVSSNSFPIISGKLGGPHFVPTFWRSPAKAAGFAETGAVNPIRP